MGLNLLIRRSLKPRTISSDDTIIKMESLSDPPVRGEVGEPGNELALEVGILGIKRFVFRSVKEETDPWL